MTIRIKKLFFRGPGTIAQQPAVARVANSPTSTLLCSTSFSQELPFLSSSGCTTTPTTPRVIFRGSTSQETAQEAAQLLMAGPQVPSSDTCTSQHSTTLHLLREPDSSGCHCSGKNLLLHLCSGRTGSFSRDDLQLPGQSFSSPPTQLLAQPSKHFL